MVIGQGTYLAILTALGCERLFEMWLSARNARRLYADGAIEVGQRHFRVMALMHGAFLFSCGLESLAFTRNASARLSAAALSAAVGAQVLRYAAVATLGERWNTRIVVLPNAPPITAGVYRWIRHPNYLAVAIEIVAVPMIRGCWITALVFSVANALMLAVRIPAEERALGRDYNRVFAARPRFIPRIRHG